MSNDLSLEEEAQRAIEMLAGRVVSNIRRYKSSEVLVEFADGARLFVDSTTSVELSIAGNRDLDEI
jgi:hypothetical protein